MKRYWHIGNKLLKYLYIKTVICNVTRSKNFCIPSHSNRGLEELSNTEEDIIRMALFCKIKIGFNPSFISIAPADQTINKKRIDKCIVQMN